MKCWYWGVRRDDLMLEWKLRLRFLLLKKVLVLMRCVHSSRKSVWSHLGTKVLASLCALAMNATVIINPKTIRVAMSMYANSILDFVVRVLLFPMVLHAARGKRSFKTSAITPVYPNTSVVGKFWSVNLRNPEFAQCPVQSWQGKCDQV